MTTMQDMWRMGAARLAGVALEVTLGVWLLLLFGVALAWDPLDRRLGLHARRHAARLAGRSDGEPPAAADAYGIAGAPAAADSDSASIDFGMALGSAAR